MVEGPVSSGTLGGPAMFVVTLIVEKMMVTSKTRLRIMNMKTTMVNSNIEMTIIRTVIMTTGKTMLSTMAMKMRMRAKSMLFGIPSLKGW